MHDLTSPHAIVTSITILWILFQLKHLVFDFLYQPPWQYKFKGTYGAFGGVFHALQHVIPTFYILWLYAKVPLPLASILASILALCEGVIHYHVDWAKMNINARMGWGPTTSENYFRFLGFDQFLHQATYIWLVWMVFQ